MSSGTRDPGRPAGRARAGLARAVKIALMVFVLGLGAVALAAWLIQEPEPLAMEYEGFD